MEQPITLEHVSFINETVLGVLCTDRGAAEKKAVPILERAHELEAYELLLGRRAIKRSQYAVHRLQPQSLHAMPLKFSLRFSHCQ